MEIRILGMRILVCAATEAEIKPLMEELQENKKEVEVLVTGVGLVAASHAITKAILLQKFDLVIQAGIAGALTEDLKPGDVVMVSSETVGDLGVVEQNQFHSLFDMGLTNRNSFPWQDGQLKNKTEHLLPQLAKVAGVTVNEITTLSERLHYYKTAIGAAVESMEGTALHYCCLMEGIPFLQLRAISNHAGERNKNNWRIQEAISNLNQVLKDLLTTIV
jgi:futalosine hydrolase